MKYIVILLATFLTILYSCGTNNNKHEENIPTKVDFDIIKTGVLHGAGEEGFFQEAVKVSNIEEFNQMQNKVNSVNKEVEDDIISGESFFNDQMLVFVFDKVRGTGGYNFSVKRAIVQNDTIEITAFSKKPEGPATSIVTQPFQILKMDKMNSEVKLLPIE